MCFIQRGRFAAQGVPEGQAMYLHSQVHFHMVLPQRDRFAGPGALETSGAFSGAGLVHFHMDLIQKVRFAGPGAPESPAMHLPLLLGRCCGSGASSKLAWKCHLIILKTSQQFHGGRGRVARDTPRKTQAQEKKVEKGGSF